MTDFSNIPDNVYQNYKESLKSKVPKAFELLIANHIVMQFETISKDALEKILDATIEVAQEMKGE